MVDKALKQSILNEYLIGGTSYRKLQKKYGVSRMTLGRWMAAYQQQEVALKEAQQQAAILQAMNGEEKSVADQAALATLATQLQQLQKQLAEEQLRNKLLTAMIEVAETELKIPIRKKYGTRQFKK